MEDVLIARLNVRFASASLNEPSFPINTTLHMRDNSFSQLPSYVRTTFVIFAIDLFALLLNLGFLQK